MAVCFDNAAILDIQHLEKDIHWGTTINYFYNNALKEIYWIDYKIHINLKQVA
jgi:hypothetical protein